MKSNAIIIANKEDKNINKTLIREKACDRKGYSTELFDFPVVQSKMDMKLIDFDSNVSKEYKELNVTQYCKY